MKDWIYERIDWMDWQLGPEWTLIHYWHFNSLPSGVLADGVVPEHSIVQGASISYLGAGDGYMDQVDDGTLLNADLSTPAGKGLRVRNPADSRELVLNIPTTGFKDISISYAVKRTTNGAREQSLYYQTTSDGEWYHLPAIIDVLEHYQLFTFDLAEIEEANNNPNLAVKVLFEGEFAAGESGNNRFDNITVEGLEMEVNAIDDTSSKLNLYYNNQQIYVVNPLSNSANVNVFDINGRLVASYNANSSGVNVFPFAPQAGVYIVQLINQKETFTRKIVAGGW